MGQNREHDVQHRGKRNITDRIRNEDNILRDDGWEWNDDDGEPIEGNEEIVSIERDQRGISRSEYREE